MSRLSAKAMWMVAIAVAVVVGIGDASMAGRTVEGISAATVEGIAAEAVVARRTRRVSRSLRRTSITDHGISIELEGHQNGASRARLNSTTWHRIRATVDGRSA
jgi:hypothetical protein